MPEKSDPEKRDFLQQQMVFLIHRCRNREAANSSVRDENGCRLPCCKQTKNFFNHMVNCKENKKCRMMHCMPSRQIARHWGMCNQADCAVCAPLNWSTRTNNNNAQVKNLHKIYTKKTLRPSITCMKFILVVWMHST